MGWPNPGSPGSGGRRTCPRWLWPRRALAASWPAPPPAFCVAAGRGRAQPGPLHSARLSAAGGAGGSAPPPARALPSAPPLPHYAWRPLPPPPCPAARSAGSQRSPRGSRARHPRGPGRGIAASPASAPLIFLFWFESARRRLAEDPLRPPPSSWHPGGTGYPRPPQGLKARFDSSKRVKGATGDPCVPGSPRPRTGSSPGRPRSCAAPGGRRRRLPFPCEAFTSLQGGTNQPRARSGRRGTARAPGRAGNPGRRCTPTNTQRWAGGAQCTQRPRLLAPVP